MFSYRALRSGNYRLVRTFVHRSSVAHIGKFSKSEILTLMEQMFSRNEANGILRYQLTKINVAKSGYAFGLCQHDTSKRPDARDFIKTCLHNAGFLSIEEIQEITNKLANYSEILSPDELEYSNKSLETDQNKSAINQFDKNYMDFEIEHVANVVSEKLTGEIGNKVKKEILENPELFLQLVDYHNQFGLGSNGPLIHFLNGESVDRSDLEHDLNAKIDTSKLMGVKLLSEIRGFINNYTQYGCAHRKDCIRRQANIDHLNYYSIQPSYPPGSLPDKYPRPQPGAMPLPRPQISPHQPPHNHPSQPINPSRPVNVPRPVPNSTPPYPFPPRPRHPNPTPKPTPPSGSSPRPRSPSNPTPSPRPPANRIPPPKPIVVRPGPLPISSTSVNHEEKSNNGSNRCRRGPKVY